MTFKFKPNDTVIYGGQGVCKLLEICEKDFGGEAKTYYVLRPAFSGSSVFYVPTGSEQLTSKLRLLKTADEIFSIVNAKTLVDWIEEDRPRQNFFKQIVDGGSTETLVSAFRLLCTKQKEYVTSGRKLRAADEKVLRDMERLLFEEFSFAFEIEKGDVEPFLFGEKELKSK